MMNKAAVAQLLGCCERSLERRVRDGQFPPCARFGKENLWFESVVDKWLQQQRDEQLAWEPPKKDRSRKARAKRTERGEPAGNPTKAPEAPRSVFSAQALSQIGKSGQSTNV